MKFLLRLVALFLFVGVVFAVGFVSRDVWASRPPAVQGLRSLVDPSSRTQSPTELFQQQYDKILANASVSVGRQKVKYAAMSGMFGAVGDPHTNFLEPADSDTFRLETNGNFVGIGARLGTDPAGAKVAVVFKGAPAEKAGVKVGDTIIEVDGKSAAGMDTDDIVKMIRGPEGSMVHIKVLRSNEAAPIGLTIRRAVVIVPSAEGRMLEPDHVGLITIASFAQPTVEQFDQALDQLIAQKADGFIFDLRGNPGGLLDSAVEMIGRFVENKQAVRTKRRGGTPETIYTPFNKVKPIKTPVVILINSDSASAAEIFSGVLQEYHKAVLVGEHSYGKSSVQNVKNLVDSSIAKITIAKYYLPSGRDIGRKLDEDGEYQSGGLKPDYEVVPSYEEETVPGDPIKDKQLRKAIEILKGKAGVQVQARRKSQETRLA
ncbi:MAG: S41 family peptidase [Armatimonadetes bacterium]|nr:S41 family peptidase [Armatimonadota bacterium]